MSFCKYHPERHPRGIYFLLLFVALSSGLRPQEQQQRIFAGGESLPTTTPAWGYKDLFLSASLGTGELAGIKSDVEIFRGIYATLGGGFSFVPFPARYFVTIARCIDYGLTWRWYNLTYTPILRVHLGRAFWPASSYDPETNITTNYTGGGDLTSALFGMEYRNDLGANVGVLVGGEWWHSRNGEKANRMTVQFHGGVSFDFRETQQ